MIKPDSVASTSSYRPQIGVTFFSFVLIGAYSGAVGVVLPNMGTYYHIDSSTLGLIFLVGTLGYLISAFTSGILTARLGQRWFLVIGVLLFLAGTLLLGFRPPFVLLLVLRILQGTGVGIMEAGFNAYVAALPRNTSIMNNLHAFYGVGALLGPVIASAFLAAHQDWSSVYILWGILSIPLIIFCGWLFSNKFVLSVQEGEKSPEKRNLYVDILKRRIIWVASLFLLFYVGIEVSMGNWNFSFLTVERHQETLLAGWVVSGYWFGLTLGRFTLATLFERWGLTTIQLIQLSIGIVVLGIGFVWLFPYFWTTALGLGLVGYGLGPIYPTTVALMPRLVPSQLLSSAIGFLISVSILGVSVFPWLLGIIAQKVGWFSLLPYSVGLTVLTFLCWLPIRVYLLRTTVDAPPALVSVEEEH